jgi:hypothetical protein
MTAKHQAGHRDTSMNPDARDRTYTRDARKFHDELVSRILRDTFSEHRVTAARAMDDCEVFMRRATAPATSASSASTASISVSTIHGATPTPHAARRSPST